MYDFVAIDFETANSNMNSACSVGLVAVKGLEVVSEDSFLIKPPTDNFGVYNTAAHGITFEDIRHCGDFSTVYDKIMEYILGSYYVVAHSAQFDMTVLRECIKYYGLEQPDFIYLDTINLSSLFCDCDGSLVSRAKFFGVEAENHHEALSDAEMCAGIVIGTIIADKAVSLRNLLDNNQNIIHKKIFSDLKDKRKSDFNLDFDLNVDLGADLDFDLKPDETVRYTSFGSFTYQQDDKTTTIPFVDCPTLDVQDKKIALTGVFSEIDRQDLKRILINKGAKVLNDVTRKTHFLIVGTLPEKAWKHKNYGSKIEKAMNWQNENVSDIAILRELDVLNALNIKRAP